MKTSVSNWLHQQLAKFYGGGDYVQKQGYEPLMYIRLILFFISYIIKKIPLLFDLPSKSLHVILLLVEYASHRILQTEGYSKVFCLLIKIVIGKVAEGFERILRITFFRILMK